jgi:hypothetical protein
MLLCGNAAAFVDVKVAWCAAWVAMTQLDRIITEAITRFDPDRAETQRQLEAEGRHVTVQLADAAVVGGSRAYVEAELDLADGRDLEEAVRQGAEDQRRLGSEDSLDVRRAKALGVLARRDLTLEFQSDGEKPAVRPRRVEWHVHSQAELEATGLVRVEETGGFITLAELRTWCGLDTQMVIRPVIQPVSTSAWTATRSPTGSRTRSPPSTPAVCTRTAPDAPGAATTTTSSPTPRAGRPARATSPPSVEATTG